MSSAESPYGYDFTSIRPHPDVSVLRSSANPSGYRNVYSHRYPGEGGAKEQWFVAKVKTCRHLQRLRGSAAPLPHQAALHVVCWYRDRYGPHWKEAAAHRTGSPTPWAVRRSAKFGGWLARVWEFGAPVEVTGSRRSGRGGERFDTPVNCRVGSRGRLLVFADKAGAEWAVRRWVYDRWGLFAPACVWKR